MDLDRNFLPEARYRPERVGHVLYQSLRNPGPCTTEQANKAMTDECRCWNPLNKRK